MTFSYALQNNNDEAVSAAATSDLFVYAVGYESRSAYFRGLLPSKFPAAFALAYGSDGIGAYDRNLAHAVRRGDELAQAQRMAISTRLSAAIERIVRSKEQVVISVDVSCLDRTVMSLVFLALVDRLRPGDCLNLLYAPAKFQEPKLLQTPLRSFQPSIPELAAPVGSPYVRRFLIMGLGYEYGAALNVLSILEPHRAHLLMPIGNDARYVEKVKQANFDFDFGLGKYEVTDYALHDPVALHSRVRDIVFSYAHYGSISIVPFGPKILSAVCLLIAINNRDVVTFMRYSVESRDLFSDVVASGDVVGLSVMVVPA